MQIFVLAMVMLLSLFEQSDWGQHDALARLGGAWVAMMMVVPKIAVVGMYGIQCHSAARRLGRRSPVRTLRRLDRVTSFYRVLALTLLLIDLSLGSLELVRQRIGNLILIDELVVILPTLLMVGAEWWLYYPIYRRLREATIIGQLDAGMPLYPTQTRQQFLLSQFRHQLALLLVPLLMLLGWREAVLRFVSPLPLTFPGVPGMPGVPGAEISLAISAQAVVGLAGVGMIFLLAPVIIRWMWDTEPLPAGEVRNRLIDMCRRYGVRIRELLLWRTFGGLGNAAVMGLIAPVRFILLTDLLLESVPQRQIEAIMAHELAHVKKKHMFWMAVCIMAIALVATTTIVSLFELAMWFDWPATRELERWSVELAVAGVVMLIWFPAFGWVSRRFERQADAFAVRHLTEYPPPDASPMRTPMLTDGLAAAHSHTPPTNTNPNDQRDEAETSANTQPIAHPPPQPTEGTPLVSYESVDAMTGALQAVAVVNQMDPLRKSWRHGSIAWRQAYLRKLIGKPINRLPIDRQVRWIETASALVLASYLALAAWTGAFTSPAGGERPGEELMQPSGPVLIMGTGGTERVEYSSEGVQ